MQIHRWITDDDSDGFFTAHCLTCGLTVLDAPVFDHEVYPLHCEPEPSHAHRMTATPIGAHCADCDLALAYTWNTGTTGDTP